MSNQGSSPDRSCDAETVVNLPRNGIWGVILPVAFVVVVAVLLSADYIRSWPDWIRTLTTLTLSFYALWTAAKAPRGLAINEYYPRTMSQWLAIALGMLGLVLVLAEIPGLQLLS